MTPESHAPAALDEPAARYLELAGRHYENFPVGSWLVPRAQRAHLHRIYAFARTADDLADEHRDRAGLHSLRRGLRAHLAGTDRSVPLLAELAATIRACSLPPEAFEDLLDAFEQDLDVRRYDDDDALFDYCRRSADPVGRLVLRVFGHRDPELDRWSDAICTSLQLLNHLQDLGEDYRERDRIYFPRTDLERFGVTPADLGADRATAGVRALVLHWADRCAGGFRRGWPLVGAVRGRLALELRAILWGAAAVLDSIRASEGDVLARHLRLPRRVRLWVLVRALVTRRMPRAFSAPS